MEHYLQNKLINSLLMLLSALMSVSFLSEDFSFKILIILFLCFVGFVLLIKKINFQYILFLVSGIIFLFIGIFQIIIWFSPPIYENHPTMPISHFFLSIIGILLFIIISLLSMKKIKKKYYEFRKKHLAIMFTGLLIRIIIEYFI